jgi:esterase
MKLHSRKIGEGTPLIILHGLFGSSDNWQTLGKHFSEKGFAVYLVDLRNHGRSPHSDEWNYKVMSDDVLELMNDNAIDKAIVIGHSMGGKTAMQLAVEHPDRLIKLVVVDIAPKKYNSTQKDVAEALQRVDLDSVTSRKEAEEILNEGIDDTGTKQFLLKNLYWKEGEKEKLAWRFNLDVIANKIEEASDELNWNGTPCNVDTLFIRGERSNYIRNEDFERIKEIFPHAVIETISGAGHWVHSEKPVEFFERIIDFLGN